MNKRKNKVRDAKCASYLLILPAIGIFSILFEYFKILYENDVVGSAIYTINYITRYIFSIFLSILFYLLIVGFIWQRLINRKNKYKVIRFIYHYNKCVEAFDNMDVQKVKFIYESRIKDIEVPNVMLEPAKNRIKFGYNVMTGNSMEEIVKPIKGYEE